MRITNQSQNTDVGYVLNFHKIVSQFVKTNLAVFCMRAIGVSIFIIFVFILFKYTNPKSTPLNLASTTSSHHLSDLLVVNNTPNDLSEVSSTISSSNPQGISNSTSTTTESTSITSIPSTQTQTSDYRGETSSQSTSSNENDQNTTVVSTPDGNAAMDVSAKSTGSNIGQSNNFSNSSMIVSVDSTKISQTTGGN